jgi:uncharacterized RDD family membrane protein YckC/antitoxin (DNA-binding transcriptional repressor) of toxin-antitoxin stability system
MLPTMKRIDLDDLPPKLAALLAAVEEGEEVLLVQCGVVAGRLAGGAPAAKPAPDAEPPSSEEQAREIFEQFRSSVEDEFEAAFAARNGCLIEVCLSNLRQGATVAEDNAPLWAGFWRRLGAIAIDSLVVGLIGYLIGLAAYDAMAHLGVFARLIGLVIAVLYFGLFGSAVAGGQTPGKRLFKLRVIGVDGTLLSTGRACGRAFILVLPTMVNGLSSRLDDGILTFAFAVLTATALFGLGLAQLYLLIFNRPSRRLVHDILFGSVVLRVESQSAEAPVAAIHRRLAFGLIAACFVASAIVTGAFTIRTPRMFAPQIKTEAGVQALPGVTSVSVVDRAMVMTTSGGGVTHSQTRIVIAKLHDWPVHPEEEAQRIVEAALSNQPLKAGQGLRVTLSYGFDMGIASGWRSYSTNMPPPPPGPGPAAWPAAVSRPT